MTLVKVNKKQIQNYFKEYRYSTYEKISRFFSVSESLIRKKFHKEIISSLSHRGKYIIYISNHKFDSNGLSRINNILFSRFGNFKDTLFALIKSRNKISSKEVYSIFGRNIRQQISQLIKDKKIFTKKKGKHSLYSIKPLQYEIVKEKEFNITLLKEGDKALKHLQIIKELKENKKIDVARKHNISVETVRNIEERFNKDGVNGLIHRRKHKAIKISSPKQAAVIAEVVKCPNKSPKEIHESVNEPIGLRKIKEIATGMKDIKAQKKIFLEIK